MRAIVLLLLGILVAGGVFYGLRLLWGAFFPANKQDLLDGQGARPVRSLLDQVLGWVLLVVTLLLFAVMVFERMQVSGEIPADWTAPPTNPSSKR
ncbi:MAG: hypothetical protein H7836_10230 [Magnetococcus sp. YQC-3]